MLEHQLWWIFEIRFSNSHDNVYGSLSSWLDFLFFHGKNDFAERSKVLLDTD